MNGFNAFVPDRLRRVAVPPPVVLTSVSVGHRPLAGPPDETRRISLGFRDKVLGLEFAALDFTAPERNRFAYKLEGFDPEWVPLRGRRSVTYTNLNPGHYSFRLRGANSDGRWNDEGLTLAVEVAAAPWATPWAYAGYVLLLAGAVVAVVRVQQRKLAREAEYARIARAAGPGEDPRAVGAAARAGARQRASWPRPASPTRSPGSPTGVS